MSIFARFIRRVSGFQCLSVGFQCRDAGLHCHDVSLQCDDVNYLSRPSCLLSSCHEKVDHREHPMKKIVHVDTRRDRYLLHFGMPDHERVPDLG